MRKLLCIIVMFVPALCFGRIPFITSRTTYSWSSTYLYDSFTDADNSTSLNGTHIPDIRPVGATYSVTTTGAYMFSGASEYRCIIDGGHSNEWLTTRLSNTDLITQFIGITDNQPLISKTHGIERFRITNDAKLGFNTTIDIPSDAALAVNGNIYARKLKLTPATWPDYAFHNNYQLRSLTEVQSFLQKNHHLPDVPSARAVQHQGVCIGNSQSILLQKIEGLTLCIIEQNKKIENLKMQIKQFAAVKEELEEIKNQLKHK